MNLKKELQTSIALGAPLGVMISILKEFKEKNGSKQKAIEVLEQLRNDTKTEKEEDLILELLDFATGFCSPNMFMLVWD